MFAYINKINRIFKEAIQFNNYNEIKMSLGNTIIIIEYVGYEFIIYTYIADTRWLVYLYLYIKYLQDQKCVR